RPRLRHGRDRGGVLTSRPLLAGGPGSRSGGRCRSRPLGALRLAPGGLMLVVSDVHDSPHALARLVELGETIVILGDLANLADYRTGDGAVAEILGRETSIQSGRARGRGDFQGMRDVWLRAVGDRGIDVRREIDLVVTR